MVATISFGLVNQTKEASAVIFKRMFHRKATLVAPPVHGGELPPTSAHQQAMRASMEAEVAADRKRRGATDARPGEAPAGQKAMHESRL